MKTMNSERMGTRAAIIFYAAAAIGLMMALMACAKDPEDQLPSDSGLLKSDHMNRMPNGGGEGTTDWMGATVGRGWRVLSPTTATIATYHGNRCQVVSSPHQFVLYSPTPYPVSGVKHRLTFRYQSTTGFLVVVRYSDGCPAYSRMFDASHEWTVVDVEFWAPRILTIMWYNRPNDPGELRLDNVNVY